MTLLATSLVLMMLPPGSHLVAAFPIATDVQEGASPLVPMSLDIGPDDDVGKFMKNRIAKQGSILLDGENWFAETDGATLRAGISCTSGEPLADADLGSVERPSMLRESISDLFQDRLRLFQ